MRKLSGRIVAVAALAILALASVTGTASATAPVRATHPSTHTTHGLGVGL
ncbi:hypothetical protein [Actinacidiphila alni]